MEHKKIENLDEKLKNVAIALCDSLPDLKCKDCGKELETDQELMTDYCYDCYQSRLTDYDIDI